MREFAWQPKASRANRLEKPLTKPGIRSIACGGGFHIKAVCRGYRVETGVARC